MALELLAGPFDIVDINADDGTTLTMLGGPYSMWVDPVGLIGEISGRSDGELAVVQMDGSGVVHAQFWINMKPGLSLLSPIESDPSSGRKWYSYNGGTVGVEIAPEYELDPVTRAAGRMLHEESLMTGSALTNYAHLNDRYIRPIGGRVDTTDNLGDTWSVERSITGLANANTLSWAREAASIWVGSSNGLIVRYNHGTKLETSAVYSIGMTCSGIWYSAKHDVFISLHAAGGGLWQTRVWARTPLPTSVSAPVALSTIRAGLVVTLRCRVLGAASEPCPNEVVAWSIDGEGTLSPETSLTDAEGYARTKWAIPLSATGTADITAEVSL